MSAVANVVLVLAAVILLVALNELRGPLAAYRALRRDAADDPSASGTGEGGRSTGPTDSAVASVLLRREIRDASLWLAIAVGLAVVAVFVIR